MKKSYTEYKDFYKIIADLDKLPDIRAMKNYRQHYDSTCYEHCKHAAFYSYCICKKFHLDYTSVARAAFVHDLFLYDWRVRQPDRKGFHAFTHPRTAYQNASKLFELNKKEKDIVLKHMWPVTIIPPKYLESYILTIVDKYSALEEFYKYYFRSKKRSN